MTEKPTYEELEKRIQKLEHVEYKFKKSEEALQESEGRYRAVVEDMPGLICSFLPGGEITFVNKAYCEYFGEPFEKLVGTNFLSLIPESEQKAVMDNISALKVESATQSHEHTVIAPNGDICWQRWTNRALFDDRGKTVGYQSIGMDITEHKEAEEALRQERNRAQKLFDIAGVMFIAIDAKGEVTLVNQKGSTVLGYEQKEILGKNWFGNFLPMFIKDQTKTVFDRLMAGEIEPIGYYENPVLTKNGEERIIAWHNTILKDDEGCISGTLSSGEDITDRKRAEEVLKEGEEKFRSALMGLPIMVNAVDQNGTIIFWNKKCEEITGYTAAEMIGNRNAMELLYPDREYLETELQKWKAKNYQLKNAELISRAKDGSAKAVLWTNPDFSTPEWIWAVGVDITKQKRTEMALQEAYSIINRSLAVAFLWKNAEGWPVEFVSDNVNELFGYKAEEFTSGKISYAEVVHPHDLERMGKEVTIFGGTEGRENFTHDPYRIVTKDGEIKWLDDMKFIRRDEKGDITHYEGIVLDISERVKAEDEKESLQDKPQRSQKMESLGFLAGGVAHDLNNVLSGIVSYPELILMDLPEDSKLRKPIETIQESGHRAAAIVQDLLTMARGAAITREPLSLNDVVSDYLNSPEFKKLKHFHPTVTVSTNLDTDLLNIDGSLIHVRKVVMNLVSNASEAIEGSGNVTISTMNRYVDRPHRGYNDVNIGEYVILSVSDNGSGISSDDFERIFEPFYTKKVMGRSGTGLGLAVVWNTVQDHKGYIDVTSDEIGTSFELYFPITRDEISDKDMLLPIKDYKGNGETILVVDDVESQREISCKMLDTLGYKTKAVSSGEEAVEYLKENTLDLLLLDMIMDPGINGRETYKRIIKIHPNQKAIIISGFAETDEVKEAQKLGVGKYLKKPFTLEKIGLAVKEELEK
jgi:PAS domain S-box-containing protein